MNPINSDPVHWVSPAQPRLADPAPSLDGAGARRLLAAAARAYQDAAFRSSTTGAQACVQGFGTDSSSLVVAFKGSTSPEDFIQDARVEHLPYPVASHGAWVHAGFGEDARSIAEPLLSTLASWRRKHGKQGGIWFTGHSLGGALAILAAAMARGWNLPVAGVCTFGQPRVGNRVFAAWFQRNTGGWSLGSRTWRFVHAADPVPWLPPWLMGYRHAGNEYFLPGHVSAGPSIGFRDSILSIARRLENRLFNPLEPLQDHSLGAYAKAMAAWEAP